MCWARRERLTETYLVFLVCSLHGPAFAKINSEVWTFTPLQQSLPALADKRGQTLLLRRRLRSAGLLASGALLPRHVTEVVAQTLKMRRAHCTSLLRICPIEAVIGKEAVEKRSIIRVGEVDESIAEICCTHRRGSAACREVKEVVLVLETSFVNHLLQLFLCDAAW
mmetsp:Transcript_29147/g.46418  ORF Transcript_29147/g.46418 Transcript_29147/m.46418 type:complete len:167 (-) Transcript_29147:1164-1664(-)